MNEQPEQKIVRQQENNTHTAFRFGTTNISTEKPMGEEYDS
jgi:hypothetical protein